MAPSQKSQITQACGLTSTPSQRGILHDFPMLVTFADHVVTHTDQVVPPVPNLFQLSPLSKDSFKKLIVLVHNTTRRTGTNLLPFGTRRVDGHIIPQHEILFGYFWFFEYYHRYVPLFEAE